MNPSDELQSFRIAAEKAFEESWKIVNLRDGWKSAKASLQQQQFTPRKVEIIEPKSVGGVTRALD